MLRLLLALTIALAAALPARAQGLVGMSAAEAEALTRAALETPYGQAHLKRFATSVRRDGDAACLQAESLDDAALVARGRALLQHYGVQMVKVLNENFDRAAYQEALSAASEPDAAAEMERLNDDPAVKKFIELYRPARLVKVLDSLTEQFDRYVLIGRFNLASVSAVARGDPTDDPTELSRGDRAKVLGGASVGAGRTISRPPGRGSCRDAEGVQDRCNEDGADGLFCRRRPRSRRTVRRKAIVEPTTLGLGIALGLMMLAVWSYAWRYPLGDPRDAGRAQADRARRRATRKR